MCAAITPWNFPCGDDHAQGRAGAGRGLHRRGQAGARTPFSALALAELAQRAGVPPGVFNVVTGNAAAIGGEMCANPTVRKLSFTGSTEVGRLLMQQARRRSRSCRSSSAATRRSSCSTTPISTRRSRARWSRSTATRGRPASARTGSSCRTGSTTRSPRSSPAKVRALKVGDGTEAGVDAGPADRRGGRRQGRGARRRRAGQGRARRRPAASAMRSAARSSSRRCSTGVTPDDGDLRARRPSGRWRRCSASGPRPK